VFRNILEFQYVIWCILLFVLATNSNRPTGISIYQLALKLQPLLDLVYSMDLGETSVYRRESGWCCYFPELTRILEPKCLKG